MDISSEKDTPPQKKDSKDTLPFSHADKDSSENCKDFEASDFLKGPLQEFKCRFKEKL